MKKNKEQQFIQTMDLFTNQLCPTCDNYLQIVNVETRHSMKQNAFLNVYIDLKCLRCGYTGERELIQ